MFKSILAAILGLFVLFQEGGTTIFMIGDSTMADKPYENGNPEKGWGQVFPLYFGDGVRIENHAVNGRSTKSFIDENRWKKVLGEIGEGDYVFIEFGHNDAKKEDPARYADPDNAYRDNLERFVRETREHGGRPVLLTPIVRRSFDERGEFYDTHGRYPDVARQVARELQVPLIDLHEKTRELVMAFGEERSKQLFLHINPGEYPGRPEGVSDDTHLSAVGAFRVCDLVVEEIREKLPVLKKMLKE